MINAVIIWISLCSAHLHITLLVCCVTILADAGVENRCPSHITNNLYLQTHAGKCYQFVFTEKKWYDANHHCVQQGGTLITIKRLDVQEFVARVLTNVTRIGSRLWIGATDDHHEQDWRWVTGHNVSSGYSNWQKGSPSCNLPPYLCREDCACLLLEEGYTWYDTFCSANDYTYGFICEYDMRNSTVSMPGQTAILKQQLDPVAVSGTDEDDTVIPPLEENPPHDSTVQRPPLSSIAFGAGDVDRCPTNIARNLYLRTHESKCYQFIFEEVKWFDAKYRCEQQGGSLLTIERPGIQEFVLHTLTNVTWAGSRLWIGATDDHHEQDWKWVTGQNVSDGYTNWQEGSPSCYLPVYLCREDCACLLLEEECLWCTTFCSANDFQYGFICQYNMTFEDTLAITAISPAATSTKQPTTKFKKNSTQTTTSTTMAKKNIPALNVTTTIMSVSNATDNIKVDGLAVTAVAELIGILAGISIAILVILWYCRHRIDMLRVHVLYKYIRSGTYGLSKAEYMYQSTPVTETLEALQIQTDPHSDGSPDITRADIVRRHCTKERSPTTSTSSTYYPCNSDTNQSDTISPGSNVPSDGEHSSLDQPLRLPVQETQPSRQPIDPANLNADTFNKEYLSLVEQYC